MYTIKIKVDRKNNYVWAMVENQVIKLMKNHKCDNSEIIRVKEDGRTVLYVSNYYTGFSDDIIKFRGVSALQYVKN